MIDQLTEEKLNALAVILEDIVSNDRSNKKGSAASLCGIFNDVADSEMVKYEKGAWERDVMDRINKGDDSF